MRSKVIAAALVLVALVVTAHLKKSYETALIRSVYAAESQATAPPEPEVGKSSKAADYSQEPFVYEHLRGKMRYEEKGTGSREIFARLHVQTPAGLAKVGQLIFDYNAATERIQIRTVRVIKPDGSVISAGPNAVQDLSAPVTREAPMYTDIRQQHVTVPGLAVGDFLEYDVVVTTFKALLPGQFWQTWKIVNDAISLDEEVDLDVPLARAIKLKSPSDVIPTVHDEGNRRIYHWATSTLSYSSPNAPATSFDIQAMLEGPRPTPSRSIRFSTFQTWAEIGTWYDQLEHDRRVAAPEIRALADEIVRGQTSDLERVRALYEWVSRNIRYVSLSFGVGWYQPHSAVEVMQNRYGDCKDKTTLLEALLDAEGIHGLPVLVNAIADIDTDVPTPHQFDHVITLVALSGHEYWLDPTTGVGPFGYLLPQLRGKTALVAGSDAASGLRNTPEALPEPTLYKIGFDGTMTEDRNLDVRLSLDTRGDLEVLLRLAFLQVPPAQMASMIQNMGKNVVPAQDQPNDMSIRDLKAGEPTETREPFHVELRIVGKSLQKAHTERSALASPFEQASQVKEALAYLLPAVQNKTDPSGKSEPQAVKLQGLKEFALNVAFTSPSGQGPIAKPLHVAISKDFAEFKADVAGDGQTFRGTWDLVLRKSQLPATEVDDYAAFVQNVKDAFASMAPKPDSLDSKQDQAQIHRTSAFTFFNNGDWEDAITEYREVIRLDPNDPRGHYDLASALFKQHVDEAISEYREALRLNPEYGTAHISLGRALSKKGDVDAAISEYREGLRLTPNDPVAHYVYANALYTKQDLDGARAEFREAIHLKPDYELAYVGLGNTLLKSQDIEGSIKEYRQALELNPDDALAHNNIGIALFRKGDVDSAITEYRRALSLDPSYASAQLNLSRALQAKEHLSETPAR